MLTLYVGYRLQSWKFIPITACTLAIDFILTVGFLNVFGVIK